MNQIKIIKKKKKKKNDDTVFNVDHFSYVAILFFSSLLPVQRDCGCSMENFVNTIYIKYKRHSDVNLCTTRLKHTNKSTQMYARRVIFLLLGNMYEP